MDKDFGELVFVFGYPHPTIIRLVDIRPKEQANIIILILNKYNDIILSSDSFITVDNERIRIRTNYDLDEH